MNSPPSMWQQVRSNLIAQVIAIAFGGLAAFVGTISALGVWWLDQRFDPLVQGITRLNEKVESLETLDRTQQKQLDDHEGRLLRGRDERLEFQTDTKEQFRTMNDHLDNIQSTIGDVNSSIIAIETLINQRLPERRASSRGTPWGNSNVE